MQSKAWIALAAVTVLAVVGAAYTVSLRDSQTVEQVIEEPLFPALMARINDVAALTLQSREESISITRNQRGDWTLVEKGGYLVSADKVKKAVVALADLKVLEAKTSNPDLYGKLELESIDKEGSKAVQVELKDQSGATIAALLVGKTRSHEAGSVPAKVYVRKPDEAASWLVEARLAVKSDPLSWLVTDIVEVSKNRRTRVGSRHPDGEQVVIEAEGEDPVSFKLRDIPDGFRVKSTQRLGAMAAALEFMKLLEVAPAAEQPFDDTAVVTDFTTLDGLKITMTTIKIDDKHWAKVAAAFDETLAGEDAVAVRAEAAEISRRVDGWVYQIPAYRAEHVTRRMQDLVDKIEPDKDAGKGDS